MRVLLPVTHCHWPNSSTPAIHHATQFTVTWFWTGWPQQPHTHTHTHVMSIYTDSLYITWVSNKGQSHGAFVTFCWHLQFGNKHVWHLAEVLNRCFWFKTLAVHLHLFNPSPQVCTSPSVTVVGSLCMNSCDTLWKCHTIISVCTRLCTGTLSTMLVTALRHSSDGVKFLYI